MCFPDEIEIVKIPKKLKEIINLYRMRKYEQADKLLEQLIGFSHQKAAIKAQIAFFNADFEHTVEYISEYFPYLSEWYSGNIKCDTIFMLEYSFVKGENTDLNQKVLNNIKNVYDILTNEQKQGKVFSQYRYYDELKRVFDGDTENTMLDKYGKKYTPPENPKRIEEVLKDFSLENKVSIGSVDDLDGFINDSRAGNMLYYMKIYTSPEDYIMVFEKLKKSKRLSMYKFLDAAMVYLYLGKKEKAEQTIVEIAKYKWIPIEETDVMPVPALSDLGAYELYTKDLFDKLAAVPCGIDPELIQQSEHLESKNDFDKIFALKTYNGFDLVKKVISKLTITSGKVIAADPLAGLTKDTLPFLEKVPKGEFDVEALIAVKNESEPIIIAVKVDFGNAAPVKYKNALYGNETQAQIDELENGEYIGFSVDSGLATIIDSKAKNDFLKFQKEWYKQNKGKDFYTDYLADLFRNSYENDPEFQRDCGDYMDILIPNTNYHIPFFASGSGDGYYPVYFGYDQKNKVCSMVIEFFEI